MDTVVSARGCALETLLVASFLNKRNLSWLVKRVGKARKYVDNNINHLANDKYNRQLQVHGGEREAEDLW